MSGIRDKMKRRSKQRLLDDRDEEEGLANPVMEEGVASGGEGVPPSGESSAETVDETAEAETLLKTLKTKRSKKKKELAQELVSPKDDLARELRTVKKRSKQKVDEEIRRESEEEGEAEGPPPPAPVVAEDGTLPMPPEEEETAVKAVVEEEVPPPEGETPAEEPEEEKVKKLRKKKEKVEETPIEAAEEPPPSEAEPTPRPPSAEKPPEEPPKPEAPKEEPKTPRGASMREKMRMRKQKAMEEAVTEIRETAREERREQRKLKGLRGKTTATRFDAELDAEELEKLAEERSQQLKLRWKKKEKPKLTYMPTAEEAYEFFTRQWEPEPEEVEEKKEEVKEKAEIEEEEKKEKKEGEEEEGEKKEGEEEDKEKEETAKKETKKPEDEEPLLPADEFVEEGYGLTVERRAEYPDPVELGKKEAEILFYPSGSAIPPDERIKKVSELEQPRYLEEEGFYVGTRPETKGGNQNRMENRLIMEAEKGRDGSKKWFGEDGRMLALPNPLRTTPSRPPVSEEPEPYLETVYRKAIMREFDSRYIDGTTEGGGNYQLDVDINSITFSHHHLFSREHVLASRLNQLYEQYIVRRKKNMAEYLTEKLRALKSSSLTLREHIETHRTEHSQSDKANYDRRLQDYKYEIRQTRQRRDKEEEDDRRLLKSIINTWKEIKSQRDLQKFNNTPVKLQVRKEEVDKAQDQVLWRQEIENEIEEMREEHQEERYKKLAQYQIQLDKHKEQQKNKKEAQKRLNKKKKKRRGSQQSVASAASGDITEEQLLKDQETIDEEDIPEPVMPEDFDEAAAREKAKAKAMEIRRRPGEPKLSLELTNTTSITPTQDVPRGEQQRRKDVSSCHLFVKILFNNKEVSRTDSKQLSQEFAAIFGKIYNLKIVQWPESIKFQIFESLGIGSNLLAELYAAIPEISVTSQTVQLDNLDFSSDHKVTHGHEGVGSGEQFSIGAKGADMITLMTTGVLSSSVSWAVGENNSPLVPPTDSSAVTSIFNAMKKMDPLAAIGASGVMDLEKLASWFADSRLDPNDPQNADIVYMLRGRAGDTAYLQPSDYFRLEQLQEEFDLVTDEEMEENRRFKLLMYRDNEVQEFRNYKMVPSNEREISRDIFVEYEKKKKDQDKIRRMEDIESHRAAVARFMQRIREDVMRRFRVLAHQKRLEDMIVEEAVPNIAMIGTSLLRITERRRPLRPERKERKKVTAQAIRGDEVKVNILVNITRASNIPVRTSTSAATGGTLTARTMDTERRGLRSLSGDTLVRPFVEVMFQQQTVRTSVGDGPNPSFNEELEMPFKAPNEDYSPSNLQTVNDTVYLNLFDEVVIDILEDDRERGSAVHQRIEKKWLGSLKIPFSTIYFNGKIDGTFRINAPPVLLGYAHHHQQTGDVDIAIGNENNTYLSMFITIEPPLTPAEAMREKFSTNEDQKLLTLADNWQADLAKRFPKREVKTTVINVNGKAVFITRYFKPIKPPEELARDTGNANVTPAEVVARYVSLIPSISDAVVFPGLCDIWSTNDQFLQMLAGDEEEHAVLLTNYFIALGKKTWLIIGSAIPEGPTAYVLTEEGNDYWIWNASTGEHFSYRDNYCPLQTVGCLVNNENIWANIQRYEKPSQMSFNLNDTAMWETVFSKKFPSPGLGSIQPESLYYFPTDKHYVEELQEKIQQMLKNKIMEWRKRYITRWNRHCTQIMRKILPGLEENCGKSVSQTHLAELEQTFSTYKVSGFPINLPFTELNPLVEAVMATGVHTQESNDVEFALAVYVHPYPNSVLSVWIYVASLVRMR